MASGSEQRQRTAPDYVHAVDPGRRGAVDGAAERAGLSLAGYARARCLPPLRPCDRPAGPRGAGPSWRCCWPSSARSAQRQSDCPRV